MKIWRWEGKTLSNIFKIISRNNLSAQSLGAQKLCVYEANH